MAHDISVCLRRHAARLAQQLDLAGGLDHAQLDEDGVQRGLVNCELIHAVELGGGLGHGAAISVQALEDKDLLDTASDEVLRQLRRELGALDTVSRAVVLGGTHRTLPTDGAFGQLRHVEHGLLAREVEHAVAVGLVDGEEMAEEGLLAEFNDLWMR